MDNVEQLIDEPEAVFNLGREDMLELISQVRPILEKEENLLQIEGETFVVGDLHGDFRAALHIMELWKESDESHLVFLGDYVDRGPRQLETVNFLLALKKAFPKRVFLLRGNHETPSVNSFYGFSRVCTAAFGERARRMYNEYNILFSYLSPACLNQSTFLVHGGIPKGLSSLKDLNTLPKGDLDARNEILGQLLWNDPSEHQQGFESNWSRGVYYTFGEHVFLQFLKAHEILMVIRAHEVFPEGYKYFFNSRLLSIFSSPDYKMSNKAAIAHLCGEKVDLVRVVF